MINHPSYRPSYTTTCYVATGRPPRGAMARIRAAVSGAAVYRAEGRWWVTVPNLGHPFDDAARAEVRAIVDECRAARGY